MSRQHEELEVKFYVAGLGVLEKRIQNLGGRLVQARIYEYNLLFDNAAGDLSHRSQLLRLRQDSAARMTFKDKGREVDQAYLRTQIEFTVSNFEEAKAFLEALGYRIRWIYEKYRAVYDLDGVMVTLDELPLGHFVEMEGPSGDRIHAVSADLGLDWEARILKNYRQLFQQVQSHFETPIGNLTFKDFAGLTILPKHLRVHTADRPSAKSDHPD